MFGGLLFLDASVLFLAKNYGQPLVKGAQATEVAHFVASALWVASSALIVTVACMTGIALLNKSLDHPKTLVVNSRLLRMAPRLPAAIFIICLPLIPELDGGQWCGAVVATLYATFLWEWLAGLEKNWKFIEPKEE